MGTLVVILRRKTVPDLTVIFFSKEEYLLRERTSGEILKDKKC